MARTISLKPGSKVYCDEMECEVLEAASLTTIKVRNIASGKVITVSVEEVSSRSPDEKPIPQAPLDSLSEKDRAIALERFKIIKPAIIRGLSRKEVEELAARHGVHYTTIYRLIQRYRETMSPASLLPKVANRGGKGRSRIDPDVEKVIQDHFDEIFRKKQVDITKLKVKSLQREIRDICNLRGFKPPSWHTVDQRLSAFIEEKKLKSRRKRKGGRSRTMAGGIFPDANFPLDVIQIDHTPLDIIIVDDVHREPIGKPYLSLAIDVFSRMVMGFSLSLDAPSVFSVGRLISQCILPKQKFLEQIGVDAEWNIFGVMGMIHLDNAGEFRAEDFVPFQEEYLVDIRWRPVATPEYGGHIERLAGTLNGYIHEEPGSTMGDIIRRAGYDSEGHACYTLDEIEKWLTILITKIYHLETHSKLVNSRGENISPLEKYEIGILGDDTKPGLGFPDVVEDQERLKIFLLPSSMRTVQREGIELDKIHYFHDILRNLYGQKGPDGKPKKFLIKRDPRRISPIYIFDPELKKYFAIPYRDLTRPPMNLWELRASKKRCGEKGISSPNEQQIFQAYGELREIREEAVAKTKKARRDRQAEKRREKDPPVHRENLAKALESSDEKIPQEVIVEDFYDDATLLDGVVVNKGQKAGSGND